MHLALRQPLNFKITALELLSKTKQIICESKESIDKITAVKPENSSFETIIRPLSLLEAKLWTETASLTFCQYIHVDKEVRAASAEATKLLDEFDIEKKMNVDLYNRVALAAKEKQTGEDQRLVDKLIQEYERNGMHLDTEKRAKLSELKKKLSELAIKFSSTMNEDSSFVEFTEEELEGCESNFLETLKKTDKGYIVTVQYPDLFGLLKHAKKESTRKAIDFKNGTKCKENVQVLKEALEIRQECAELLGFNNWSDFRLQDRMAKNLENVENFLNELKIKLLPKGKEELKKLLELKKREKIERKEDFDGQINTWDFHYYHQMLLKEEYNVQEDKIQEYFPTDFVLEEMLQIYQTVLELEFEKIEGFPVWHEQVTFYSVVDSKTKEQVGHFFLDLYPRDGKYGHAACFDLIPGYVSDKRQYPVAAVVANFTKPQGSKPSLLKHGEVVTLFHEFGHAMHQLCAQTKHSKFHGTNVETDFVEAPSQMLENWCWQVPNLIKLSKHFQTGEQIPQSLVESLVSAKNVNSGLTYLRQMFFACFDITLHSKKTDIETLWTTLKRDITLIPDHPGTYGYASFGHLMGGYDSGYYGYMWSLVFACDMFERFKVKGAGKEYRQKILLPGGSKDGMDMIKDFLGREPSQVPFLKSIGLQ